jgi:hypothetical protein
VQTVGLGEDAPPEMGWTPWGTWPPFFLDTTLANQLGYQPAGTYSETVRAAVDDLLGLSAPERASVESDSYFQHRLDYRVDDAALAYQDASAAT